MSYRTTRAFERRPSTPRFMFCTGECVLTECNCSRGFWKLYWPNGVLKDPGPIVRLRGN